MDALSLEAELLRLGACEEGRAWARGKALAEAWGTCARGDWLMWLAVRVGVDRRRIVLAACACARLTLEHAFDDEAALRSRA
ncbi:uncharacterized protein SOCE836_054680 [Sorangium cellulosum]|uniref:Uncharacterized protein n=1 Tax=Sorangium cellulosum TaxID=56 RepID=A0A4V0NGI7_SORCE|nr:uncharacterized protein SOCE836_054680 [Sorangium cellulosum]WCQ92625.1 hypothetical protein NQZ70_05368 [Sorangium sp. Soce836]